LVSPLLASWGIGSVPTLVVFVLDFAPVGAEDGATRGLVALDHGSACLFIRTSIDLLEQVVETVAVLVVFELFLDLLVQVLNIDFLLAR